MQGTDRRDYQNNLGSTLSSRRFGFDQAFQHDTVLAPNDCGGPLVDIEGRVVGFNIARAGRTESYAIPANIVVSRMYDLMSGNLAPRGEEHVVTHEEPAAPQEPAEGDASAAPPAKEGAQDSNKQAEGTSPDETAPDRETPEGEMPGDTPSAEESPEPAPSADE
jgi:S1-C subfamily serine protease